MCIYLLTKISKYKVISPTLTIKLFCTFKTHFKTQSVLRFLELQVFFFLLCIKSTEVPPTCIASQNYLKWDKHCEGWTEMINDLVKSEKINVLTSMSKCCYLTFLKQAAWLAFFTNWSFLLGEDVLNSLFSSVHNTYLSQKTRETC